MTYITTTFGKISTNNSTTLSLSASGTYNGTYEQVTEYSTASITLIIGNSENCTLNIDFSVDNIGTNETTKSFIVNGGNPQNIFTFSIVSEYFRIRIIADQSTAINGAAQTVYNKTGSKDPPQIVSDSVYDTNTCNTNQSILIGKDTNNIYRKGTIESIKGVNSLASYITHPLDAFGRLQVSNPHFMFGSTQLTTNSPFQWDTSASGGTSTYTLGFPQTTMQVSSNTDRVVRQQHGYNIYQPGKSMLILCTGTLLEDSSVTNVRARIGYFDDLSDKTVDDNPTGDGFFFQLVGGGSPVTSVVYRTSNDSTIPPTTPPTETDSVIAQNSWNIDKLDGTGTSGITIDFTKRQVYFIHFEWMGTGNVVMGVYYNNKPLPCHQFKFSGGQYGSNSTVAYTCRGSLPVRFELEATAAPSGTATMRQISASVLQEGGYIPKGPIFSISRTSTESLSGLEPVFSIRLNSSGTANIRPRVILKILTANIMCTSGGNMRYVIIKFHNPSAFGSGPLSGGGGPSWQNSSDDNYLNNSAAEYDYTANSVNITGSTYPLTIIEQGYFSNNMDALNVDLTDKLYLQSNIAGQSDWATIAVDAIGGTETIIANMSWCELE